MNRLEQLKNQIRKNLRVNIIFPEPFNPQAQAIMDFQEKLDVFHEKLNICQDNSQVKSHLLALQKDFLKIQSSPGFKQNIYNVKSMYETLENRFNFGDGDECLQWIDASIENIKGRSLLYNLLPSKKENVFNLAKNNEIQEKLQPLLHKYNLGFFTYQNTASVKSIVEFLDNFDSQAQALVNDMKAVPSVVGLHGNLGLENKKMDFNQVAYYSFHRKTIGCDSKIRKSSILHEWVHAVDHYVSTQFLQQTDSMNMVSGNEFSYISDDTDIGKAYTLIRKMTSEMFNLSKKETQKIIASKEKEIFSKSGLLLFGNTWYGLSDKERESILSPEIIKGLKNFLINPSPPYEKEIVDALVASGKISSLDAVKNIHASQDTLKKEILPIFDEVEHNKKGRGSFYYYGCVWQNMRNVQVAIEDLSGIFGGKKINSHHDYYTRPHEMLARYFESQVYHKKTVFSAFKYMVAFNVFGLTPLSLMTPFVFNSSMKFLKDKSFDSNKDQLLTCLFGEQSLLKYKPVSIEVKVPSMVHSSSWDGLQQIKEKLQESNKDVKFSVVKSANDDFRAYFHAQKETPTIKEMIQTTLEDKIISYSQSLSQTEQKIKSWFDEKFEAEVKSAVRQIYVSQQRHNTSTDKELSASLKI